MGVFKDRAPISKGGKGAPLFVCLIDFEKAFDKVDRKLIWLRLEKRGINGRCPEANINKTETCVFSTRSASTPDVQVYYLGQLIKVVNSITYLGHNFRPFLVTPEKGTVSTKYRDRMRMSELSGK